MDEPNEYLLVRQSAVTEISEAFENALAVFTAIEDHITFMQKYSWMPIPAPLRTGRPREVSRQLAAAIQNLKSQSPALGRSKNTSTLLKAFGEVASEIADGLPEIVFNFTTKEALVEQINVVMVENLILTTPALRKKKPPTSP
jgi:hypothetical protein